MQGRHEKMRLRAKQGFLVSGKAGWHLVWAAALGLGGAAILLNCGSPVTRGGANFEDGTAGGKNASPNSPNDSDFERRVEILPGELSEPSFSRASGLSRLLADSGTGSGVVSGSVQPKLPSMQQSDFDPKFCDGAVYGTCLTLIIQIPAAHLQVSPGLSTLNLIQAAPTYSGLFERACNEGMQVSMPSIARGGPGRSRVLGAVTKSRCIVQSLADEVSPLPKLGANEIGFKVRFVSFELAGDVSQTSPAFGTLAFERSRMDLKFHDAQLFARGSWQPIKGSVNFWNMLNYAGVFGTARASVRFNESLTFQFNGKGTAAYLSSVIAPVLDAAKSGQGLGQLGTEIMVVRQAVAAIAAGSNPVVPALILVGVAADAIHDLCTHEQSSCEIKGKNTNVRDVFLARVGAGQVVTSETRAAFVDGLKFLPYAVLKGVFESTNIGDLESKLDLPTRPFWVAR
jgi:hypothetical protein